MHRIRTLVLSLAFLLVAGPAIAKDLCFVDGGGNIIVIQKVKKLKNPGKSFPVKGYAVIPGNMYAAPVTGTAVGNSDGQVVYGVTIYNLLEGTNQSVTGLWNPESGVVTTHWDTDGDGSVNLSDQWDPMDCRDVVLP